MNRFWKHTIEAPEEKNREWGRIIFEKILAGKFPKLNPSGHGSKKLSKPQEE